MNALFTVFICWRGCRTAFSVVGACHHGVCMQTASHRRWRVALVAAPLRNKVYSRVRITRKETRNNTYSPCDDLFAEAVSSIPIKGGTPTTEMMTLFLMAASRYPRIARRLYSPLGRESHIGSPSERVTSNRRDGSVDQRYPPNFIWQGTVHTYIYSILFSLFR